ncbi:hypothetical protein LZ554_009599 [Drepanopeziza brunnea f. sp. 'monogermtubi']|nr:hypothetical protein LZ554_009599 [Drepanopeziza brunnea f. sp. 'monogermtubi']
MPTWLRQIGVFYESRIDFAKLRPHLFSELLFADSIDQATTSYERLTNDPAKLNSRLRDEVVRTLAVKEFLVVRLPVRFSTHRREARQKGTDLLQNTMFSDAPEALGGGSISEALGGRATSEAIEAYRKPSKYIKSPRPRSTSTSSLLR